MSARDDYPTVARYRNPFLAEPYKSEVTRCMDEIDRLRALSNTPHVELLTDAEHKIIADAGQLWNDLCGIVLPGPCRESDLDELVHHIHAIQRVVLAQAAKRAYPDMYRQLGQAPPSTVA